MDKFNLPHYTELVKGDLWLMASGKIAHLIGTNLLGDASFLFKYDDGTLVQIYPGLSGCKDQPLVKYKQLQKQVEERTQQEIKNIINNATTGMIAAYIKEFKKSYSNTIGMEYDEYGTFIGYIPKVTKELL